MTPSDDLMGFMRGWEGRGGKPALGAYWDAIGKVWTIGYGHTGHDTGIGRTITADDAEQILVADMATPVDMVGRMVLIPLEQCQFDALCAFAFNVGSGALHSSTLLRLVNAASLDQAALQFTRWDHDHAGNEVGGLYKRRVAEQRMFIDGDYSMRP